MSRHAKQEWRDIPGYNGMYQISRWGEVRTWRWRGKQLMKEPRLMHQYLSKGGKNSRSLFVKLTDSTGKGRAITVLRLMVDTWLGGCPPGKVPYHKNGDLTDHCLHNIAFATRSELGKMTGAKSKRRPVAKIAPDGEIVEVYSSARAAAKANHMSYQTVLDRCNGKVQKPFALDGFNYLFDDDGRKGGELYGDA